MDTTFLHAYRHVPTHNVDHIQRGDYNAFTLTVNDKNVYKYFTVYLTGDSVAHLLEYGETSDVSAYALSYNEGCKLIHLLLEHASSNDIVRLTIKRYKPLIAEGPAGLYRHVLGGLPAHLPLTGEYDLFERFKYPW